MTPTVWLRAYPHGLVAALCLGLAAANALRPGWPALALAIAGVGLAFLGGASAVVRAGALVVSLALAGLWWGGLRLDALDRSALRGEVGRSATALVTVTGPARRGLFSIRAPAEAARFGRLAVDEPVLLELPLGRSPPQGGKLDAIVSVELPRTASDGFDERAWLRRQGVHVVLRVHRWRVVGRRGGLSGAADRLRARLSDSMAPGLRGERRALVAGIVLGADEGLSDELRDRFRASGLYHLLAVVETTLTTSANAADRPSRRGARTGTILTRGKEGSPGRLSRGDACPKSAACYVLDKR